MSLRQAASGHKGAIVAVFAVTMSLTLAGCGGGDDAADDTSDRRPSADARDAGATTKDERNGQRTPTPTPSGTIGELRGPDGVVLTLHSAVRDKGGFVTVNGTVTNHGDKSFTAIKWLSKETEVKSSSSISGASLVDPVGKKRYLVLRDTDGECLCSTGLANIQPDDSRTVFAQFPAPPASVTTVDFQLPTMPSVSIDITG